MAEASAGPRSFCGTAVALDDVADDAALPRWRAPGRLLWCARGSLPGLSVEDTLDAYWRAWDAWQAVCAMTHGQTAWPGWAQVLMVAAPIDGPRGVLARSGLPGPGVAQVRQEYDTGDDWVTSFDPFLVALHELGHALGLGHEYQELAVMNPNYNPAVRRLQPADVREALRRYPPRAAAITGG